MNKQNINDNDYYLKFKNAAPLVLSLASTE